MTFCVCQEKCLHLLQAAQRDVVDIFLRENTTEAIDPLDAKTKWARLQERIDAALSELDTQIKVSNVTTTIEF